MSDQDPDSPLPPPHVSESPEGSVAPGLLHQWVLAAMVSAAARFVPVPFVDDFIRSRSRQFAVARTLKAHGREYGSSGLSEFYGGAGGCISGCGAFVLRLPLRLLLFPLRKFLALMTSVHGVPMDLMKTLLIARTLDRCLRRGMLPNDKTTPRAGQLRREQTAQMRAAFEEAIAGMNWKLVRSAVNDALAHSAGWRQAAAALATSVFQSRQIPQEDLHTSEEIEAGAQQVEAVLRRPQTLELFRQFDARFDATLSRLQSGPAEL